MEKVTTDIASKNSLREYILEYLKTNDRIKRLTDHKSKISEQIIKAMKSGNLDQIQEDSYTVRIQKYERETISKKNLPIEVWEKYKKKSVGDRLYVKEKKANV